MQLCVAWSMQRSYAARSQASSRTCREPCDCHTELTTCVQGVKLDDGQTLADLQLHDGEFLVAVEARKKPGNNNGPPLDALAIEPSLKLPPAQVAAPLDSCWRITLTALAASLLCRVSMPEMV